MKYYVATFGCQMNHSDSERIAVVLENKGYKPSPTPGEADLVVINACSVREKPINKIKNLIARLPEKQIILTGCVLKKDKQIFSKLGIVIKQFEKIENIKPITGLVPIMRGCNNFCSYCAVPFTRGREKYRSQKAIITEVKHLSKKKTKEITLLGQNVNSYPSFVKLLQKLTALPGNFKITFITNHPKDFKDELIKEIASNPKIKKYVHLPFQAGDNAILKKMNRHYTRAQYLKLVDKIKKAIPNVEITTDVIVGFPGETKKQFEHTLDVIKKIKFSQVFIGKYSPRPGTASSRIKDSVPLETKKLREQTILNLLKPDKGCPCQMLTRAALVKLVVILGPTASGKTDLSIKLAKKFNGEIVSADSRQVYKGMDIGTGKITKKEMQGIPHHLIDIASPRVKFSVSRYQRLASQAIKQVYKKNNLPFLVGGSPFYIYSITEGWIFPNMKNNPKLRQELVKKSIDQLFKILKKLDPERASNIEVKNKRRLVRAIEIAKTLGKVPTLDKKPVYDCLVLGIDIPKRELEIKISKRVDKMIKQGLEKEAKSLPKTDTIGYREWEEYFKGKATKQEIIERIKINTIKFSKRQMTWFKRDKNIHWIKTYQQAEKLIKNFLN